jgi:hypothetical protein
MKATRYEIGYESKTGSGTKFVLATSDAEALRLFREEWEEYGDEAPTCWIVGRWAVNA